MKISVCLATYNGQKFLADQLASIVHQLQSGDEIVVADDGSSDRTVEIASSFAPWIRLISTTRVGGVVKNFERTIAAANGDVIVLCDQDDVWLDGRVDAIRSACMSADLVLLNGQVVDAELAPRQNSVFQLVNMRSGFMPNLLKNSFIGCCMAFRRNIRDAIIPFPNGVPWHDWYIGLFAEATGRVHRIDSISMLYRRHGDNFSPTGEKSKNGLFKKILIRYQVARAVAIAVIRSRRMPSAAN